MKAQGESHNPIGEKPINTNDSPWITGEEMQSIAQVSNEIERK